MIKQAVALLLAALSLSGCTKPEERFTTKPDVMFRLVALDECGYCKTADYSSDGQPASEIKLGPILVRPEDIEYVARSNDENSQLKFAYKESAHKRILEITSDNFGKRMALMAGDRAVSIATISQPFSKGSEISGITAADADYVLKQIAERQLKP